MRRTKILNATEVKRTSYTEAANAFYRHCKLKKAGTSCELRDIAGSASKWYIMTQESAAAAAPG